ncbi:tRNA-uridine aminocarboxypropyltransferase [Vibrio zhanjiangensis]|uniref:tRNA-uridine aminocarboxypropyltransferase n=1 Tax=Vibrio zhanjiangensis TaxID=1046128 RepID=UPI0024E1964D|nr:DTW domain-containing protein [Vibrio zhanjiangensis]
MAAFCPECQLRYNCICEYLPSIEINAHIALLMHENELTRDTNTGQWLLKSTQTTSQHIWQRKRPCSRLMALITHPNYQPLLLFPEKHSQLINNAIWLSQSQGKKPLFIIIDGTWQEARKIVRKSPWLNDIPKVHIKTSRPSSYQLRRNQELGNLCTLEVGAEIIQALGDKSSAEKLRLFLGHYCQAFHADKSGHQFDSKSAKRRKEAG